MSVFRFRLATLLRLRLAERDERRSDLAKALRAAEILRGERSSLNAEGAANVQLLRRLSGPGGGNVDAMIQAHRYVAILKARAAQLAAQQVQIEREIERRRMILMEADRQVRVLEKLRERQAAEHHRRMDQLEARRLDEVGSLGFVRQRRAGA